MGVSHIEWIGDFNPQEKMIRSFEVFQNITHRDSLIYHTDLDEIPDIKSLAKALKELENGECDAVLGFWRDRVSENGKLLKVHHGKQSLQEQFPLRCHISEVCAIISLAVCKIDSNKCNVLSEFCRWWNDQKNFALSGKLPR